MEHPWRLRSDDNMSPLPCAAVPTGPSPHIIDLYESLPQCSTYLSHAHNLPDVPMIDPFFSPPPHPQQSQGIRLDILPPSHHLDLPPTHMWHTCIDLGASPWCTPLPLPGAAALQPRPTLGGTTQLLLQIMHQPALSPSKPSGPWPLPLRAQSLAQLVAGACSIQAEHTNIHKMLHHLKEWLEDASDQ
ncbi:hypothetical protein PAXRUDRAFT_172399 [Paxillus rubicundulus Ve08.2h10]|uniref:Uncharacterized protein n=1 Tax=Paxillus rubicundulus Ve08.2h10 TaxID=930991 RepID=A0A0D0CWU6_9AGAM|nr:hypothetical protein PAXRUDRAFT_172399 [Paxillus rubicundulus Ve08.2h10]